MRQNITALSKEQFWDKIKEDHPDAFKAFGEWIDQYKRKPECAPDFYPPFNAGSKDEPTQPRLKFHDLPGEMQYGVCLRFYMEMMGSAEPIYQIVQAQATNINIFFKTIQKHASRKNSPEQGTEKINTDENS